MLTLGFVLDLTFSYLYYLWFPETKKLPWELRFLTQAREIYGKSITILFKYKINQTETDTTDVSYSHKYHFKWPTPLFSWDRQRLQYKWLWSFYTLLKWWPFCPSIYSGCFTCLMFFKLYINPTCYILSLPFGTRKDWGLENLVCLNYQSP